MKREVREKARELRATGHAVHDIAKLLNVSKSSVSIWVRDIILTDAQIEHLKKTKARYGAQNKGAQTNRAKFLEVRKQYQEQGRIAARQGRPLHMAGCMLYWAEGAKQKNDVLFVNSDPNMMLMFMRFLREELHVSDEECAIRIHCHSQDRDVQIAAETYWLNLLRLSRSCLRKTIYKQGSVIRKNILENGVCGIRVHRSELMQHIYGAIQEYGGFDNPKWLF